MNFFKHRKGRQHEANLSADVFMLSLMRRDNQNSLPDDSNNIEEEDDDNERQRNRTTNRNVRDPRGNHINDYDSSVPTSLPLAASAPMEITVMAPPLPPPPPPPPPPLPPRNTLQAQGRTASTCLRLQRQGLAPSLVTRRTSGYAVQSIHRGSEQWDKLLQPFVSDLVFQSIASRKYDNVLTFRPYTCHAAVLFVDLSGYSKITAAILSKGAHVLSASVNAYLTRLLEIIYDHGGDVLTFAGDALLAVWEGDEQELEVNVFCAARCAVELQEKAGEHPVEIDKSHYNNDENNNNNNNSHKNLKFQIHCGLCCGILESEIFQAPVHNNMQRLYHYVGGETMLEIGELVDLAQPGEIAISRNCYNFLESGATYKERVLVGKDSNQSSNAKLLQSLTNDDADMAELMDWHIQKTMLERSKRRNRSIEEDFIHPNVLSYLSHGGLSPTQIAQMRNLCVLFIAKTTSSSSPVNWLTEIQAILDKSHCPIVQIILDDKGVHLVAAVNLHEAVPEASLVGLDICRILVEKRVGAAVGIALGPAFCGVTGSDRACRWDITGHAVVRAARLMQYALSKKVDFAIDHSLYQDPMAATRMRVLDPAVPVKGSPIPIPVYTLSDSRSYNAFRILENVHGGLHNDYVQAIQNHIDSRHRSAVVVTGCPMAGMRIVCERAAGYSDLVPYLHLCDASAGFVQLGRTIATWFSYVDNVEIRRLAKSVIDDLDTGCWSCAHDHCVNLVNVAIEKGFHACFVVDRIQVLDNFSLSLIRECLRTPRIPSQARPAPASPAINVTRSTSSELAQGYDPNMGQICFLCIHNPLYSAVRVHDLVNDLTRSHTSFTIPVVEIGEASKSELRVLMRDFADVEVEDRWLEAYAEASGYCAEYFLERFTAVRDLSAELWKESKPALMETSEDLVLHIPPRLVYRNKRLKVTEIRAETAMHFSRIFDELPPVCQLVIKILTIATRGDFYSLPYKIIWEALNDIIATGVDRDVLDKILEELVEICIVKNEDLDGSSVGNKSGNDKDLTNVFSIQNPALKDIAWDVCTPVQVQSIAKVLIERLQSIMEQRFEVSLVMADLYSLLEGKEILSQHLWLQAYERFQLRSVSWEPRRVAKWLEIFDDEIRSHGYDPNGILQKFSVPIQLRKVVSPCISMLKVYSAPLALGPMGLSLSVICRNTYHEYGLFHSGSSSDATKLANATSSACGRYMMQQGIVENYLNEFELGASMEERDAELEIISFLANPANNPGEVETKAVLILEEFIPRFTEHRLERLHKLVKLVKENKKDPLSKKDCQKASIVMDFAPRPIRRAYEALQNTAKSQMDAAQDALMILATTNWKPRSIPEYLPMSYHHTVANLRNKTLKPLTPVEFLMFRHQQGVEDLEAFLLLTPLLQKANDDGLC